MEPTLRATEASEHGETENIAEHPKRPNPWKIFAGIWRENPDFDAFLKEIQDLRREANEAEKES